MKKSLLALAALTAFAGAASAQSSVTLFGILDVDARSVSNGSAGSLKTLSTNGNASSRLGFRGIEDLGGGLRAAFWLEGDISPDVGGGNKVTAGAANGSTADPMVWTRRSTVALLGGFGEIRLGRDYTPIFNNLAAYDMFGYVGVSSIANIRNAGLNATLTGLGTGGTPVRANNTISYFLPELGGLYGQAEVAAGEAVANNKHIGARLGYAAGPVNVSGAYGKTYKTCTAALCMVDDLKVFNFGASFNLGFMTIQGTFEKSDYSVAEQKLISGGVLIPIGAGTIKLNYTQAKGSVDTYGAKLLGAGYVYDLSKRTAIYVGYGRIQNAGNLTVGGQFVSTSGGPAGILKGETSTGYDFGIRHNF